MQLAPDPLFQPSTRPAAVLVDEDDPGLFKGPLYISEGPNIGVSGSPLEIDKRTFSHVRSMRQSLP